MIRDGHISLLGGGRSDLDGIHENLAPEYSVERLGDLSSLRPPEGGSPWAIVLGDAKQERSSDALMETVASLSSSAGLFVVMDEERTGELLPAIRDGKDIRYFAPTETVQLLDEVRRFMRNAQPSVRSVERRSFPRVQLPGAIIVTPAGVELNDISTGGVSFLASEDFPVGKEFDFVFRLTAARPALRLRARVLRDESAALGRRRIAAAFIHPKPRVAHLLRGAVLAGVAVKGLRELQARVREDGDPQGPRTADPARVRELMQQLAEHKCECLMSGPLRSEPFSAHILRVDAATGTLHLSAPPSGTLLRAGDALDSTVNFDYESYLFSVVVASVDVNSVTCDEPKVVYFSEKRTHRRHIVPSAADVYFEFDLEHPAQCVRWPVVDFGAGGLGVETPADSAMFLRGARIEDARVVIGERILFETSAEVRHATLVGDGLRVGIRFTDEGGLRAVTRHSAEYKLEQATEQATEQPAEEEAAATTRIRAPRVVRFANCDGEEVIGLCDTNYEGDDAFEATTVIIPPAWGRTKESFSTFAAAIVETFRNAGEPVVVLRFDYTHCRGESHVPKENRQSGRETFDFLCSRATGDIRSAIDWVHDNEIFRPGKVVLLGPSFSAPMALQVASRDERVSILICPMGAPDMQDLLKNCTGGIDYLGSARRGVRAGVINLLGLLVDMTSVAEDLMSTGLAFMDQARRAIAEMQAPVVWLCGEHDAWINPERVKTLLDSKRCGGGHLVRLDAGHLATSVAGDDTLLVSAEIVRTILAHVSLDANVSLPSAPTLEQISRAEWQRAPTAALDDSRGYWNDYLLGTRQGATAFDVIKETSAYREFMATQTELMELAPGQRVLDAGCGTGNFLDLALSEGNADSMQGTAVVHADFVPAALARARDKVESRAARHGVGTEFAQISLEASRLRPVAEFVHGELPGFASLRGRIPGLSDELVLEITDAYDARLHAGLRGDPAALLASLPRLSPAAAALARDVSRAARVVRSSLLPQDARPERILAVRELISSSRMEDIDLSDLAFDVLDFGDTPLSEPLDLGTQCYDRILSSLVLPYIFSPEYTAAAFHRALRDGGIAVVSTMRPDADISKLYSDFVARVQSGDYVPPDGVPAETVLNDLREYANSAAFLLRLAEEGTFRFFSARQLGDLLRNAGFRDVTVHASFGEPAQAYVATGRK